MDVNYYSIIIEPIMMLSVFCFTWAGLGPHSTLTHSIKDELGDRPEGSPGAVQTLGQAFISRVSIRQAVAERLRQDREVQVVRVFLRHHAFTQLRGPPTHRDN